MTSALYVRSDSDATTVVAPRLHASAKLNGTAGVDATYAIDSWTGASIDVVTAATHAIHEIRREVSAGGYYDFKNVTVSGGYRYSGENDYWSNGGIVTVASDFADNNATLSASLFGSKDTVGRSGDPDFKKDSDSLGGRLTLSQVLDPNTVVQLSAESLRLTGYLASPYRYVGMYRGGLCSGTGIDCVPETQPGNRLRNAFSARIRRALGKITSLGVDYRQYFDSWGVLSETVSPDVAVLIGKHGTLSLAYRFYTQSEADFYKARYTSPLNGSRHYFSRDRKLSPMQSNHIGAEYVHGFELGDGGQMLLELATRASWTRFRYRNFVGLSSVDAVELTGLVSLNYR